MTLPTIVLAGIVLLTAGSTAAVCLLWGIKQEVRKREAFCRQIIDLIPRDKREERPLRRQQIKTPTQLSNKAAAGK